MSKIRKNLFKVFAKIKKRGTVLTQETFKAIKAITKYSMNTNVQNPFFIIFLFKQIHNKFQFY